MSASFTIDSILGSCVKNGVKPDNHSAPMGNSDECESPSEESRQSIEDFHSTERPQCDMEPPSLSDWQILLGNSNHLYFAYVNHRNKSLVNNTFSDKK